MAGSFGRGRGSSIRFQSCGRYRNRRSITRERKAVLVENSARPLRKQQQPTKKKFSQSKAGTTSSTKAQEGSESGSSEESSSPTTLSNPKPKPTASPHFTRRRSGRRRGGPSAFHPCLLLPPPTAIPRIHFEPPAYFFTTTTTTTSSATQKTLVFSFFLFIPSARLRTCEIARKNGRKFPPPTSAAAAHHRNHQPSSGFFKIRPEEHWGRDRGGPRWAHCKVYWAQRPPQQGLHCQRPKGPPCKALCPHCHSILRCPRPPWLRPPQ